MKNKIITSLLVLFLFSSVSNAQALLIILFGDKLSTETFQMGINASLGYSGLNGAPGNPEYRVDWAFGAFGEVKFTDKWYLHFDLTIKTPAGQE